MHWSYSRQRVSPKATENESHGDAQKLLGDDWSLEFVDADGDCFFACVSKAFDGDPTTQDLRDVVADACDDETLESFRAARAAGLEDYDFVDDCDDLDALRARLRIPGGAAGCVWADDFALRTIAAHQKVGFAILDEAARCRALRRHRPSECHDRAPADAAPTLQPHRPRGHAHTFSRDEIDAHWAVRGEDDADEAPRAKRARRTRERCCSLRTRYTYHRAVGPFRRENADHPAWRPGRDWARASRGTARVRDVVRGRAGRVVRRIGGDGRTTIQIEKVQHRRERLPLPRRAVLDGLVGHPERARPRARRRVDATPARWRGDAGSSPLDRARTAA